MDVQKLKIKLGDHEFEAEGPADVVQAQFAAWRDLVAAIPARPATPAPTLPDAPAVAEIPVGPTVTDRLDRITKQEGRVVSLTVRGASVEDEIMLVLYGQRMLRDNDSVTGAEVLDGLRLTGRTVNRVDYQLDKLTSAGDVITIGIGRARRYRLTNQGTAKAREVARALIAKVA
jgi:hypothetical protein